jgi:hypothetical protein
MKDSKGIVLVQNGPGALAKSANEVFNESYALFSPNYGGAKVSYLGARAEEGKSYEAISVTPSHGLEEQWWFDGATWLLARRIVISGGHTTTTMLSDYKSADGVMIACRRIITNDNGLRETIVITTWTAPFAISLRTYNAPLPRRMISHCLVARPASQLKSSIITFFSMLALTEKVRFISGLIPEAATSWIRQSPGQLALAPRVVSVSAASVHARAKCNLRESIRSL